MFSRDAKAERRLEEFVMAMKRITPKNPKAITSRLDD